MPEPPEERCANHPERPAGRHCDRCRRPFCSDCLVELQARELCAGCKALLLREMQAPGDPYRPPVIRAARFFNAAVVVVVLAFPLLVPLLAPEYFLKTRLPSGLPPVIIAPGVTANPLITWQDILAGATGVLTVLARLNDRPRRRAGYRLQAAAGILALAAPLWLGLPGLLLTAWAAGLLWRWRRPDARRYFGVEADERGGEP